MIQRILIGGGMVALGIFLFFHWFMSNDTKVVSVIVDITDSQKAKPDIVGIRSIFNLTENKWKGSVFRYSNLTDVSLNETKEKSIPKRSVLLSNEFERAKEINEFSDFIIASLSENRGSALEKY